MQQDRIIKDSVAGGWVEHMPEAVRPYLRLSRYDRPIGFWLLALPGWIGLAFAAIRTGFVWADLKWAVLIGIGAIAMRGAGCTYNDIVDRDLDRRVERTALRPLAAGTISLKSAWVWLVLQSLVGLTVLAFFPRIAQIIAMSSLALVAAYPFMKRITYWPQAWLGLTFNWAVLVAYTAKTGIVSGPLFLLYIGLVFWTIGYDTIYACQDVEDDALIGVKSTARLFGDKVNLGVALFYTLSVILVGISALMEVWSVNPGFIIFIWSLLIVFLAGYAMHLYGQVKSLQKMGGERALALFKSNLWAGWLLVAGIALLGFTLHGNIFTIFGGVFA